MNTSSNNRVDGDTCQSGRDSLSQRSECHNDLTRNERHESPERECIKTPPLPVLKSAQKIKNVTPEWPTISSDMSMLKADLSFASKQLKENEESKTPTRPVLKSVEKSRRKVGGIAGTPDDFQSSYTSMSSVQRTLRFD